MKFWRFSEKYIRYLLKPSDWIRYELRRFDDISPKVKELCDELNSSDYRIKELLYQVRDSKSIFRSHYLSDVLAFRHLSRVLLRAYKIQLVDRNKIVSQIVTILSSDTPLKIVRTDIKSFFSSINFDEVIRIIERDGNVGSRDLEVLRSVAEKAKSVGENGLPWGLSISAVLSEIYMRDINRSARALPGVYYYARYVDDIVIFSSVDPISVRNSLVEYLGSLESGLLINEQKTKCLAERDNQLAKKIDFTYLGYRFERQRKRSGKANVRITIALSKVARIKRKLKLAIEDYENNLIVSDLETRIRIITGNYFLKRKDHASPIKAGIAFSYSDITCLKQLELLDRYYRKEIRNCIFRLLQRQEIGNPRSRMRSLFKYSFKQGFKNKISHKISRMKLENLSKIWTNV